jgi:uncharacterized membrane protein YozB (DUF420 family)
LRGGKHVLTPRQREHAFFSAMAIASSLAITGGFLNTYGARIMAGSDAPAIIHLHAAVFTSWLVLFVAQTLLIANGRVATHKKIGAASVALVALMLVTGVAAAIAVTRAGHRGIPGVEFPTAAGFLLLNINSVMVFVLLFAAGWYYRHQAQVHKRLMLTATTGALIGPGVSRLPVASGNRALIAGLVFAFLFAGPVYDLLTRKRVHPAYLWACALALMAIGPVEAYASTGAWRAIASWIGVSE